MASVHTLRKDTSVFLIGNYVPQIIGNRLPWIHQVLEVLFFNMREVMLDLRDSASLVIKETMIFWNKARIPTREPQRCIENLEGLYKDWRSLQKDVKKTTEYYIKKISLFVFKLNDLFDIAHTNSLDLISLDEDKQFLINQRKKGRPGSICGIDMKLNQKETRVAQKEEKEIKRKQKYSGT
jgi:adenylate/nucleoside-diphosphate kinase